MSRLLRSFVLVLMVAFTACQKKDDSIDPDKRVRPVSLRMEVIGSQYVLTWEPVYIVCFTGPCPDAGNVEAESYEVQISTSELGAFRRYTSLDPALKMVTIPAQSVGNQLVARVVSVHKGASPVNSNTLMATIGPVAEPTEFMGYGTATDTFGGDIMPDGSKSTYSTFIQQANGSYATPLYVSDLQNDKLINSKLVTSSGAGGVFSPDGKQLACASRNQREIIIYDIATETSQSRPLPDSTIIWSLDWSPDGKWIAYSKVSNQDSRLWKLSTVSGPPVPLTPVLPFSESNNIGQSSIQWSPDGRFIAVSRAQKDEPTGNWRSVISFYSPEGNGEVSYFDGQPGWNDRNPAFSPDGKTLAFLSSRTGPLDKYSLWIRNLTTSQLQQIRLPANQQLSYDYAPHWIGTNKLVYMAYTQGRKHYFTVSL